MLLADAYLDRIDFLRYLPRTDCGDCGAGNCSEFVEKLKHTEKKIQDCPFIRPQLYYPFEIALRADRILPKFPCLMSPEPGPTGLMEINRPGRNSPVLISGNNVHTQDVLAVMLATTRTAFFLLFSDTRGDTVDMALILESMTPPRILKEMRESGILKGTSRGRIIIPGLASALSHELARMTGNRIIVGPVCAGELPLFFGARWRPPE